MRVFALSQGERSGILSLPSPLGRGCPAAGAFTSRSGTGEGSLVHLGVLCRIVTSIASCTLGTNFSGTYTTNPLGILSRLIPNVLKIILQSLSPHLARVGMNAAIKLDRQAMF
jgi:hypothetical protein